MIDPVTVSVGKKFYLSPAEEKTLHDLACEISDALVHKKMGYRVLVVQNTMKIFKTVRGALGRSHAN